MGVVVERVTELALLREQVPSAVCNSDCGLLSGVEGSIHTGSRRFLHSRDSDACIQFLVAFYQVRQRTVCSNSMQQLCLLPSQHTMEEARGDFHLDSWHLPVAKPMGYEVLLVLLTCRCSSPCIVILPGEKVLILNIRWYSWHVAALRLTWEVTRHCSGTWRKPVQRRSCDCSRPSSERLEAL